MSNKHLLKVLTEVQSSTDEDLSQSQPKVWDAVDQAMIGTIEKGALWNKSTLLKSAPTRAKVEILEVSCAALGEKLRQFELLSRKGRYSMLTVEQAREYVDLAKAIVVGLGAEDMLYSGRVPYKNGVVNSVSVETINGYKEIQLRHAMVTQLDVDLVILSSINDTKRSPGGFIIDQIRDCYGFKAVYKNPFLYFESDKWTDLQMGRIPDTPFKYLMTVMLPKVDEKTDSDKRITSMCAGIYSSLAALEGMNKEIRRIAMPVLQGHLIPVEKYKPLIECLLRTCAQWLKASQHTQEVSLCVYYQDEVEVWSNTIDIVLGRQSVKLARKAAIATLCKETAEFAHKVAGSKISQEARSVQSLLHNHQKINIEALMGSGRKLVERICKEILLENRVKPKFELREIIPQLFDCGVSPWVIQYMQTIRILGNEGVHIKENNFYPDRLTEDDLVTGIAAIRALIGFWIMRGANRKNL